jgi:hypothetical protein
MATPRIDTEALARAAIGRTLYTLDKNLPNRVLDVSDGAVLVRTDETADPAGSPVPLTVIQRAADQLAAEGQLRLNPETLGHRRTSFVGALLASDPSVVPLVKPATTSSRDWRSAGSYLTRTSWDSRAETSADSQPRRATLRPVHWPAT